MANTPRLDILAIAAHPDDAEITCGGLLIKMANAGRKTGVVDLTRGEMGTYGDEHDRAREMADAAKLLGLTYRGNLEMPDSAVECNQENKLKIAQAIRDTQPELVLLPHWEQRHPDHLACSRLGYDACFLAGLKKADLDGEPFRPRKIAYVSYFRNTDYSFLVDISEVFIRKVKAVAAYTSQFGDAGKIIAAIEEGGSLRGLSNADRPVFHSSISAFELIQTRARQLGQLVHVDYAEAFTIKEHMLVNDPQKLPVKSI